MKNRSFILIGAMVGFIVSATLFFKVLGGFWRGIGHGYISVGRLFYSASGVAYAFSGFFQGLIVIIAIIAFIWVLWRLGIIQLIIRLIAGGK